MRMANTASLACTFRSWQAPVRVVENVVESANGVACLAGNLLFELLEQQEGESGLDLDAFCALEEMATSQTDISGGVIKENARDTVDGGGKREEGGKEEKEEEEVKEVFDFSWPKELRGIHASPQPAPLCDPSIPAPRIRTWRRPGNSELPGEDALGESRASRRKSFQERKTNKKGKLKKVRFLLPGDTRDPEDLSQMPIDELNGRLFVAAEGGDVELAMDLLKVGADPNITDGGGVPLLHACLNNKVGVALELLQGMLQHDADPEATLPVCRWTPLHKAAALGYTDAARLLLMYGASKHFEKADGAKPLAMALMNGRQQVADLLKESKYIPVVAISQGAVGSLQLLCSIHIRKQLGVHRNASVDNLDIPEAMKWHLNYNQPFTPVPQAEVFADELQNDSNDANELEEGADGVEGGNNEGHESTEVHTQSVKVIKEIKEIDEYVTGSADDSSGNAANNVNNNKVTGADVTSSTDGGGDAGGSEEDGSALPQCGVALVAAAVGVALFWVARRMMASRRLLR